MVLEVLEGPQQKNFCSLWLGMQIVFLTTCLSWSKRTGGERCVCLPGQCYSGWIKWLFPFPLQNRSAQHLHFLFFFSKALIKFWRLYLIICSVFFHRCFELILETPQFCQAALVQQKTSKHSGVMFQIDFKELLLAFFPFQVPLRTVCMSVLLIGGICAVSEL